MRGVDATVFYPNTDEDVLECETIMQDVVQRRRRVFGPAHPETRNCEDLLSQARAILAHPFYSEDARRRRLDRAQKKTGRSAVRGEVHAEAYGAAPDDGL